MSDKDTAQLELTGGIPTANANSTAVEGSGKLAVYPESPYGLIRTALSDPACDPEKLRAMLDVQKDWESNEQRKAFCKDLVKFQSECKIIAPLDQGDKNRYAKLDRIWRETRELRAECGLSVVWQACKIDPECKACELAGMLVHRDGHTLDIARTMPVPEEITAKATGKRVQNATQRAGSAESYCKRYAVLSVLGVVIGVDDDGEGTGGNLINAKDRDELAGILDKLPDEHTRKLYDEYKIEELAQLTAKQADKLVPWARKMAREHGVAQDEAF
jgi:hypothetical protein